MSAGAGFRLSPPQRRLWALQEADGGQPCRAVSLLRVDGPLEADRLRRAAGRVVERYEILRTTFPCPPGLRLPVQRIDRNAPQWHEAADLAGLDPAERRAALDELVRGAWDAPVDLENGPSLNLTVVRLAPEEHAVILGLAALCADAASLRNLAGEIARRYALEGNSLATSGPAERDEEPLQYADLAEWQNELLTSEDTQGGRDHWAAWDPTACRAIQLPFDASPAPGARFCPRSVPLPVDPDLTRRLADETQVSAEVFWLTAWLVLLWRLTGRREAVIGLVAEGRSYEGLAQALGPLAKLVPLHAALAGEASFRETLGTIRAAVETAAEWAEFFSWDSILQRHGLGLEDSVFRACFEAAPAAAWETAGLTWRLQRSDACIDHFRVKLLVREEGEGSAGELFYDASRISAGDAERLAASLAAILASAVADPDAPIDRLGLGGPGERLAAPEDAPEASGKLVHELFAEQAQRVPERVAAVCEDASTTYRELAERAERLAIFLARRGVAPEALVALCLERSLAMPLAVLGVLGAGGAYLPLDPGLPRERKALLLADARPRLILTESRFLPGLPAGERETVCLDGDWEKEVEEGARRGKSGAAPGNLVYVIYTSGSTGFPKGVAVEHRQLTHYLLGIRERLALADRAAFAMVSTFAADLGNTMLFPSLCLGGTLHLLTPERAADGGALASYFGRHPADYLKVTPSHLQALLAGGTAEQLLPRRCLVLGGEASRRDWIDGLRAAVPGLSIVNHYGPTETTIGALTCRTEDMSRRSMNVPLGRPLPGTSAWVLGPDFDPLPAWFPGELHLGGPAVTRGYLNRPDLTAERFIPDPFSSCPGARLYRTGDLARQLPEGTIEFLGRVDHQVKIRGFRVEPGEIEALLQGHPEIRSAVVTAHDDGSGGKRLAAYLVFTGERAVPVAELREFLRERVPDYMIPAAFLPVASLPLSANGKVDRRALPEPDWRHLTTGEGYVPPATPIEELLAQVWAEVLGVERVGAHDNFFHLGGDSIRGIVARARAEERGAVFSIEQIFEHPVLRDLAWSMEQGDAPAAGKQPTEPFSLLAEADRARLPVGVEDAYPLATLQAGMLFHSEVGVGTAIFHDLHSVHIRAPFAPDRMREAVRQLSLLHPLLRTSFDLASFSEPLQLVHTGVTVPLEVHDLPREEQEEAVTEWLRRERLRAFDWTRPPLVAFHVHPRAGASFQFTMSFHHAILDGWSSASLLTDLFRRYALLVQGKETPPDAPLAVAYGDFVALERAAVSSQEPRSFWGRMLDGAVPTRLPRLSPPDTGPGPEAEIHNLRPRVDPALSEGAKRAAREAEVPLKSLMLAVFLRVSSALGGTPDVLTALISHGRPEHADGERVLGLFLNTLPFRARLPGGSWRDLAQEVFDLERRMLPFRRFPFAEMQRMQGGRLDLEIAFNYLHYHVYQGAADVRDIEVLGEQDYEETNFPLLVYVLLEPLSQHLRIGLGYRRSELDAGEVERFADYLLRALNAVVADPGSRYDTTLLSAAERHQILAEWGDTAASVPGESILQLIEAQVERTPDAVAVIFESTSLSYAELDAAANRLANRLRSLGAGPESLVGVAMERSCELVIALLGTLKTGGAYVPLDPGYPRERLATMLTDSGARILLHQERLAAGLPQTEARMLSLDHPGAGLATESDRRPRIAIGGSNAAYMIYTSGSTGKPKGAVNTHRGLLNRLLWMQSAYLLTPEDRVLQKTPFSFDVSVWEFFWPLMTGSRLVVARPDGHWDPAYLSGLIEREGVTTLHFVPSMLQLFLQEPGSARCPSLRLVVASGEALSFELQQRFYQHFDPAGVELHNLYGPTEAAIDVTSWPCRPSPEPARVPIGRPVANTAIRILDAWLQPVAPGIPGELCIGGAQLARGYLGHPELTADRFIPDPVGEAKGERLYRSGDLARYRPDGAIDYLGRIDFQVKIRGVRIELGEIEATLLRHGAREAVVVARRDRLVAYVVPDEGEEAGPAALREALLACLPAAMVPAAWVVLPCLPLTANGKVDRRALPEPEAPAGGPGYAEPRTAAERTLAAIWAEVLQAGRVGLHDNFFALGGDSILSIQICARAQRAGVHVTPKLLFQHPTVAELAAAADRAGAGAVVAEQGLVTGPTPLTPIQRWFFADDPAEPHHFNQAVLFETARRLDRDALAAALDRLERHHDALRLRFDRGPAGWRQTGGPPAQRVPLTVVDLAALPAPAQPRAIEAAAAQAQASLDLGRGPLYQVLLVDLGTRQPGRLFWAIHHLGVDGVSWRILLEDLAAIYDGLIGGHAAGLPAKTSSFRLWAERLALLAGSPEAEAELSYWLRHPWTAASRLPLDRPEGREAPEANTVASERSVSLQLDAEETRALLQEVPQAYNTQINDALLTALARGFHDWNGSPVLLLDLEGHGREEIFPDVDLSRTVGWFTSLYPVLLDLREASGPGGALAAVKEQLRRVPRGGLGYGLLRWLSRHAADLAALPRPEVVFNYLGQLDASLHASSPFRPARESGEPAYSPRRRRSHLLAFNGGVFEGRLGFTCTYSASLYRPETIQRLVEAVTDRLRELIDHCRSPEAGGYTPSDFPLASLSAGQLEKLLATHRKVAQP